jgi:DNA-binding transcriptional LysR family regulator
MLDFNSIRTFAKVAELRSISGAARALGMPKSSVSREVGRLEASLGAKLLQRSTRQVALTDAGTAFHGHCTTILKGIEEAEIAVVHLQGAPRGLLRVACPFAFARGFLAPLLGGFLHDHPEVRVELVLSAFTREAIDPIAADVDVTIRFGPVPDSSLIAMTLPTVPIRLFASPTYLDRRGRPKTPDDLADHDLSDFLTVQRGDAWELNGPGGKRLLPIAPRLTVNDPATVYEAVRGGAGIGALPDIICMADVGARVLEHVLPEWSLPASEAHALFAPHRRHSPKLRAFLDWLQAQAREYLRVNGTGVTFQ